MRAVDSPPVKNQMPPLRELGFGFWWTWLMWHFIPQSGLASFEGIDPIGIVRIGLMAGLVITTLSIVFMRKRLSPLHERARALYVFLGVGSLGTIAVNLANYGLLGEMWLFTGSVMMGLALGPLTVLWAELFGTQGTRRVSILASASVVLGSLLYFVTVVVSRVVPGLEVVLLVSMPWISFVLLSESWKKATPPIHPSAAEERPLRLPPIIVGGVIVYGFVYGFMLSLIAKALTPPPGLMTSGTIQVIGAGVAGLLLLAGTLLTSREFDIGFIYRPVLPLVIVGFLLLPVVGSGRSYVASAFTVAGYFCFLIFSSIIYADITYRLPAPAAAVGATGWGVASGGVGVGIVIYYVAADRLITGATSLASVSLIVVFVLVLASTFLFSDRNVSSLWGLIEPSSAEIRDVSLDTCCAAIAERCGLTPREQEVLVMLARGRNREYIQKALGVSSYTVKTHIKRIYTKLGVHSHQELIDLTDTGKPSLAARQHSKHQKRNQ